MRGADCGAARKQPFVGPLRSREAQSEMTSPSLVGRLDPRSRSLAIHALAAIFCTTLSTTTLCIPARAAYVTTTLNPTSVMVSWGTPGNQPLSVLTVQDSAGTGLDLAKAQQYTPIATGYHANFHFQIPQGVDVAGAAGLALTVNFYGQTKAVQKWSFEVRDQIAHSWLTLGYNAVPAAHTWTPLTFPLSGVFSRFVSPSGDIEMRYLTAYAGEASDLDFLGFAVTAYVADPPPGAAGVRTEFDGDFSNTPDQVNFVVNFHDFQVTGMGASKIAALHAATPSAEIYWYQKVAGAKSTDPRWSQTQSLLWYGPSGQPVRQSENGWYWIDIITPSKRAAWIPILIADIQDQLALGYDAVYLDDVAVIDPSLITEYPSNYTSAAYYAALGNVLAAVRAALPGHKILINSYTGGAAPGQRGMELLSSCDGMSFEAFSMKASSKFMDRTRWLQQTHDFESTIAQGKSALAIDYMTSTDMQRRMWSLASYLIANGDLAYHRIGGTDIDSSLQQYPEDSLVIGTALGDPIERSDDLVMRSYSKATVVANPDSATITYSMGTGSWQKLVLEGGGAYPNAGSVTWSAITGTSIAIPANSAVIVRPAQ